MDFPTLLIEFPQRVTWETCFGSLWTAHLLDRVHPQCISVWSLQGHQGRLASVHCLPGNNYLLLIRFKILWIFWSLRQNNIWEYHLHRREHRHQRSPGLSPGNPQGLESWLSSWVLSVARSSIITVFHLGVERSLPMLLVYSRKAFVISAHTVWLPRSHASVLKQMIRTSLKMVAVLVKWWR